MGFFRDWRRKRVLRRARLDEALWARVASRLSYLRGLSKEEAARLKELVVLFLAEKEMHGAQGFRLTDEVRLSIAVQACLPILNLGLDVYNGWVGVVVYPGEFRVRKEEMDQDGIVHTFDEELAGEAWPGLPGELLVEGVHNSVDRKSTRLNSSHQIISYAVFCLKKKPQQRDTPG